MQELKLERKATPATVTADADGEAKQSCIWGEKRRAGGERKRRRDGARGERRKRGREEAAGRVREGASKEWGTRGGKKRWEVMGRALREEEKGSSGEWIALAQREEEKGRERVGDE
eukprot:2681141-Rhodomonas_salina.2